MISSRFGLLLVPFLLSAAIVDAATTPRRIALVVGANRGAAGRVPLRYAVADAERFGSVLTEMGGVLPPDLVILREPTRRAFLDTLAVVRGRAAEVRPASGRAEVIVYYSGHADEKGLMLGRETVTYRELKDAMHGISADVGIGILDACASGVITRLKGGRVQPGFLTDEAMQMKGYAFLTSSSENEAAQESERLRGSYFTHALLSGLRGAADASGDGRVTLNEAYQYAFHETLDQTAATEGGAQHPSYDIRMAGTGDVVITDVRETSCAILLGPELDGRFWVRNAKRMLVAELYKPAGRTVELGLEPGTYTIHYERAPQLLDSSVTLVEGDRTAIQESSFRVVKRAEARKRGGEVDDEAPQGLRMKGRTRVEGFGGFGDSFVRVEADGTTVAVGGWQGGVGLVHFFREDLALEFQTLATDLRVATLDASPNWGASETNGSFGVLIGARSYVPSQTFGGNIRPYASVGLGPFTDYYVYSGWDRTEVESNETRLGGQLGGGVDLQISRLFSLGMKAAVIFRDGREPSFGMTFGCGFAWGRGRR